MKTRQIQFPLLAAVALILCSCSSILPGNDPVVVNAERTTQLAVDVFDTFLKWEYNNRSALAFKPEVKQAADFIRDNGIGWLESARSMTKAYKENRSQENKFNLDTALAILRQAISEARKYLTQGVNG